MTLAAVRLTLVHVLCPTGELANPSELCMCGWSHHMGEVQGAWNVYMVAWVMHRTLT